MLDLKKGLKEIQSKTHLEIEEDAAWSWANRAGACYYSVSHGGLSPQDALRRFIEAEDAFGEALEHSSKTETLGALTHTIQTQLEPFQAAAVKAINNHLLKTNP